MAVPTITEMRVIPVAGRDSMLLNLSGAHGPFFTRNVVDPDGQRRPYRRRRSPGRREDPPDPRGCAAARRSAADRRPSSASCSSVRERFADRDAGGRGLQTFDLRIDDPCGHRDRVGAARPARPVSRRAGRGAARRRSAARQRSRCSATCSTSATARRRTCRIVSEPDAGRTTGSRVRHEEALTPDAVVRLAEAAHARYGFNDFKLKGGVLRGEDEMAAVDRAARALSRRRASRSIPTAPGRSTTRFA